MTGLVGRRGECDVLDRLVDAVRAGESRALVVLGEPGVGKTALLDYVAGRASGFRVARVRVPGGDLAGLPELVVAGLPEADARALLDSVTAASLDERVRDRIVAETGRARRLTVCTASRSVTSAAPGTAPTWPVLTCSTENGCAASAAARTRASSCAPPTPCWTKWAWRRSPSGPGAS